MASAITSLPGLTDLKHYDVEFTCGKRISRRFQKPNWSVLRQELVSSSDSGEIEGRAHTGAGTYGNAQLLPCRDEKRRAVEPSEGSRRSLHSPWTPMHGVTETIANAVKCFHQLRTALNSAGRMGVPDCHSGRLGKRSLPQSPSVAPARLALLDSQLSARSSRNERPTPTAY